jgi:NADH:ubiquinone oxidoreductase subunit K
MTPATPTTAFVAVGFIAMIGLLGAGLYGLLAMRNLIRIIIALQILVKGAVLALVLAGKANGQTNLGQSLAATVIMADTVAAVIGLALAVQVKRRVGTLDVRVLSRLRE